MSHDDIARDALVAFSLTPQQEQALATVIADNAILGWRSAYYDALRAAHVPPTVPPLGSLVLLAIQQRAQAMASVIAATYQRELANAIQAALAAVASSATAAQLRYTLWSALRAWASSRSDYKASQIANMEVGYGADLGTRAAIHDLQATTPSTAHRLRIRVVPSESSGDFCQQYAGQTFALADLDSIPAFPAHPNCIHEIELERY